MTFLPVCEAKPAEQKCGDEGGTSELRSELCGSVSFSSRLFALRPRGRLARTARAGLTGFFDRGVRVTEHGNDGRDRRFPFPSSTMSNVQRVASQTRLEDAFDVNVEDLQTLGTFIINTARDEDTSDLSILIQSIGTSCKYIANCVRKLGLANGKLGGKAGTETCRARNR